MLYRIIQGEIVHADRNTDVRGLRLLSQVAQLVSGTEDTFAHTYDAPCQEGLWVCILDGLNLDVPSARAAALVEFGRWEHDYFVDYDTVRGSIEQCFHDVFLRQQ